MNKKEFNKTIRFIENKIKDMNNMSVLKLFFNGYNMDIFPSFDFVISDDKKDYIFTIAEINNEIKLLDNVDIGYKDDIYSFIEFNLSSRLEETQ